VLAAVPCGIGHGYAFPVLLSVVISRAPIDARGVAMAIYTSIDWAATLASGPIAGVLIERAGYPTTFAALAATLATGTALFYAFDRR
jgi:predicted MFS family arabinose efflux permease